MLVGLEVVLEVVLELELELEVVGLEMVELEVVELEVVLELLWVEEEDGEDKLEVELDGAEEDDDDELEASTTLLACISKWYTLELIVAAEAVHRHIQALNTREASFLQFPSQVGIAIKEVMAEVEDVEVGLEVVPVER